MFFTVPEWEVGQPAVESKKKKKKSNVNKHTDGGEDAKVQHTIPVANQSAKKAKISNEKAIKEAAEKMVKAGNGAKRAKLADDTQRMEARIISLPEERTFKSKAESKLSGARFRFLNQKLYESSSDDALHYFRQNPDDFVHYHCGFREQTKAWPVNPVDIFIRRLRGMETRGRKLTVADMGCGEAKIGQTFRDSASITVRSFDLAAVNELVTVASMTKVPMEALSTDIVIFSLSLMNTDYLEAIREAHRILKSTYSFS